MYNLFFCSRHFRMCPVRDADFISAIRILRIVSNGVCTLELVLEIRKCLYKLSHISPRSGIARMSRTQVADETCKKALGGAYRLKRKVRDSMAQLAGEATNFVPQECSQIDMLHNKFDTLDILIETGTLCCEETHPATRLVVREYKKTAEERARDTNEDEIYHGG